MEAKNPLEQAIASLVYEKADKRFQEGAVPHDLPLGTLGINAIDICDLSVSLEEMYGLTIVESAEEMASWSITSLTQFVKDKILSRSSVTPNWKTSFEGLVFTGQLRALRTPLTIHLDATFRCNMRCVFCYDSSGSGSGMKELSTEELKNIMDQCHDLDVLEITYGGGEPFIRKDFLEIVEYSKKYRIRSAILSNGTLISKKIAGKLADLLDPRFDMVQVSLDGPNPAIHDRQRGVPGGFEKTMQGIRNLQEVGIRPTVNTVLTSHNYGHIPSMIPFLMENGINSYRVLRLHPLGRALDMDFYNQWKTSPEESEWLFEFLTQKREELVGQFHISEDDACIFPWSAASIREKMPPMPGREPPSYACGAGTTRFSIAPDGGVFPCSYMYDFPELKVGSLRENSMQELWDKDSLWDLYRSPVTPSGKCRNCPYLFYCRTGCKILSYALYGDMGAPDAGCTYEPEAVQARALAG